MWCCFPSWRGDYATGIYSAEYRPLGAIQLVPYGVLYSLLPALSRNAGGKEERRHLERAMGLLLIAAFLVVLATMVFADPAVRLLLGERYAESALGLKILIWAVILRYVNYALNVRLLAGGHEWVFLVTSLVCLGVNVIGNLLLIPLYSWRAAAALTIFTEIVLLAQNTYWLHRIVGVVPRPLGAVRNSLVFAILLVTLLAGARLVPPFLIGSVGVLLFVVYLYRTGMLREFAAAWRAGRSSAALLGRRPNSSAGLKPSGWSFHIYVGGEPPAENHPGASAPLLLIQEGNCGGLPSSDEEGRRVSGGGGAEQAMSKFHCRAKALIR
jgi:O-antigen/teichoic acid export membrane protein